MSETADSGQVEILVETEVIDADDNGSIDIVSEVTTIVADVDGDGVIDAVEQTTVTAYDLTGDGRADVIESTTITGIDADGDGVIGDDEITIETVEATREDLDALD